MSAAVADHRFHSHFSAMGTTGGDGGSSDGNGNGSSSSGFSEEDLLASMAGFGVEGQVERDLATIKSMLSSTNSGFNNTIGRPAGAASFGWPFQTAALQQQYQQHCLNNPPPNTPTLSKSMELSGNTPEMQYFGNGFPLNGSGSRRRDVSLDRSYNASSGPSYGNTSVELDDTMEDAEQGSGRHSFAGSARPGMHQRKQSANMDQMEGIQEESARDDDDSGGTTSQQEPPFHFHLASPPPRPSSATSNKRRQHTPPIPASPPQTRSRARQQAALAGF